MPVCDRFEIAVVRFPFVDAPTAKRRPALALATADFVRANGHGIFAMITSAKRSAWPSDISLRDWREAGLPAPSVLRWKVFTLHEAVILDRVGRLAAFDETAAESGLALLQGFTQVGRA
jgi:mRNA interferase MazF